MGGVSAAFGKGLAGQVAGVMATAAFENVIQQAAISFINNKGNLGKTFEDLGSKEQIKGLVVAIAVAGITCGIGKQFSISQEGLKLSDRFQRAAVRTGVGTAFNVVTQDLDVKKALLQGGINIAANALGAFAANEIAYLNFEGSLDYFGHKFLHAVLGAAIGAASNLDDPLKGAGGGAIGALGAEVIAGSLPNTIPEQTRANIGVILAASAAFGANQDVNSAGLAAQNAMENNFLFTATLLAMAGHEKGREILRDMAEATEDYIVAPAMEVLESDAVLVSAIKKNMQERLNRAIEINELIIQNPNTPEYLKSRAREYTRGYQEEIHRISNWSTTYGGVGLEAIGFLPLPVGRLTLVAKEVSPFMQPMRQAVQSLWAKALAPHIPQIRLNYQAGRSFQQSVHAFLRVPENHEIFKVLLPGRGKVGTKPDLSITYGVTDIKNVKYITFQKQLQAQAALAKDKGTSFNVIISPWTEKISKKVSEQVFKNKGKIFEFNPEAQKMIERVIEGNKVLR